MNTIGKIVAIVCTFSTLLMGCYSNQTLSRDSISEGGSLKILKVTTLDDEVFEFQEFMGDYGVVRDSVITGVLADAGKSISDGKGSEKYLITPVLDTRVNRTYDRISIPLSRVQRIDARKPEVGTTVLVVVGLGLVVLGFAIGSSLHGVP